MSMGWSGATGYEMPFSEGKTGFTLPLTSSMFLGEATEDTGSSLAVIWMAKELVCPSPVTLSSSSPFWILP